MTGQLELQFGAQTNESNKYKMHTTSTTVTDSTISTHQTFLGKF